jgi:alkanesulfonate monooxygenase SsuD/methylene tetrahydromethanopterin reductase-like flavin-dependent oxidoreductase (luciferase family)
VEIGINLPVMVPGMTRDDVLGWCRRVDAAPFSSLAAGERMCFPNPEQLALLSAAAVLTTRPRIATTVVVLPMHRTVVLAKQMATLDVLSGGRLSLGVGAGARDEDYAAAETERPARPLAHIEAQVALLRRIWAGESVVPGALRPVEPAPLQAGGPEILAGSLSERAIRRVARFADGLTGHSFAPDPAEMERSFAVARSAWQEAGRERPPRLVTAFWYALGPGARAQLDEYLHRYLRFLGEDLAKTLARSVRVDSAEKLRTALREAEAAGADEVLLIPTTRDPEDVDRVTDLVF